MRTVYLKLTNGCNLKCKHCYNEQMSNHSKMNDDVIKDAISYINALAKSEKVQVQLHGGEPFLLKAEKIKNICDRLDSSVEINATTNLAYVLTPQIIDIFKLFAPVHSANPLVQTSWDYKIRFANDVQEKLWISNVKTLLQNNVDVQVTVCLTKLLINEVTPKALFEYFTSLGVKYINFERLTSNGSMLQNDWLMPSNTDVSSWLLDAYIEHKKHDITVSFFVAIENSIKGYFIGCRERKCTQTVVTINPDGSVASCPNTAHRPFASIKELLEESQCTRQKQIIWIKQEQIRNQQCYSCKYFKYCNGDCFQLAWDRTGCPGPKLIYECILNERQ
nr:MAG TPA_asm: Fe-S oxidoreductase [Caudoviricetes sp.]